MSRSYGIFEDKFRAVLDQEAPMSTVQLRNNYKPWVDDENKEWMVNRDRLQETARRTQLPANWNAYKTARNK